MRESQGILKIQYISSFLLMIIGFIADVATLVPGVEFGWLKYIGQLFPSGLILLCITIWFWISDKDEKIDAFIRTSENMQNVLSNVNDTVEKLSDTQSGGHESEGNAFEALEKMQNQLEYMSKIIRSRSTLEYKTTDVTRRLEDFIEAHANEISDVHIICFGRSGYEHAINSIVDKYYDISVKVIFCNPEKNKMICLEDDDRKIRENAKNLLMERKEHGAKIDIFLSDIPPAIRASIVYKKKGEAVWGAIQSYNFAWENNSLTLVRPKESLIIVGDETTAKSDFDGIIKCIADELRRLGKSVKKKAELGDKGVIFIDGKWEDVNDSES